MTSELGPHFCRKANKVSKSEWTRKVDIVYHFGNCADAIYTKISKLVRDCRNYSLSKLACFETLCSALKTDDYQA